MNDQARRFWAKTTLHVWPERYALVSLPLALLSGTAALLSRSEGAFAALIVAQDEVSLTIEERLWGGSDLRPQAHAEDGPYRAITFDVNLDLSLTGYLAPAAVRLAEAGVSIVPQCAYSKDHLLIHHQDLEVAIQVLENFIRDCRRAASPSGASTPP